MAWHLEALRGSRAYIGDLALANTPAVAIGVANFAPCVPYIQVTMTLELLL
jgi:hypothetical protein